ncbi:multiple coagulation factor deficiency protein 2 homolog isoform X2 [Folsomia candida]|nr:multiple coagulation factor deficiency protein 2 homolog isoform X2 [Folsomia candida]
MRGPHHPRNSPKVVSPGHTHGQQHNHYVPRVSPDQPAPILTHDKNVLHDQEHIKEDLGEWVTADGKEMTPEEMEFHYFKMHDFDNNSLLDGLEILQAISHIMPDDGDGVDLGKGSAAINAENQKRMTTEEERQKQTDDDFNYYIELIDRVLEEDDLNRDGYLSYFEYAVGRRRDDKREKALRSSNPSQI